MHLARDTLAHVCNPEPYLGSVFPLTGAQKAVFKIYLWLGSVRILVLSGPSHLQGKDRDGCIGHHRSACRVFLLICQSISKPTHLYWAPTVCAALWHCYSSGDTGVSPTAEVSSDTSTLTPGLQAGVTPLSSLPTYPRSQRVPSTFTSSFPPHPRPGGIVSTWSTVSF